MTIFGSRGGLNWAVPVKQSQGTTENVRRETEVRFSAIQDARNSAELESTNVQSTLDGDECPPSSNPSS
jgi:hypothetical protein